MKSQRLMSIDALRGFDMFWIIGAWEILLSFAALFGLEGFASVVRTQSEHVAWEGLHFIDFIFPVFVFVAGLSYPFSHAKQVGRGDAKSAMILKVVRRMALLFVLGLFYNGTLKADWHHPTTLRYASVLGQIGVAWGLAALVYMFSSWRGRLGACLGGLLLYAILLPFVDPAAQGVATVSPSLKPLTMIFACPSALLGMLAGDIVRSDRFAPWRKVGLLALCGAVCVAVGLAFSPISPIVKKLWTPTFILVTAGAGFIAFALFYAVIDVVGWWRWSFAFQLIGMNAIFIYITTKLVNYVGQAQFFVGGIASLAGPARDFILALSYMSWKIVLLYFMYRRKIFLKV